MFLYADDKKAPYYKVIDLNTGLEILHCVFANDETGEYEVYSCDEDGNPRFVRQDYLTEKRKVNIKLVKKEE